MDGLALGKEVRVLFAGSLRGGEPLEHKFSEFSALVNLLHKSHYMKEISKNLPGTRCSAERCCHTFSKVSAIGYLLCKTHHAKEFWEFLPVVDFDRELLALDAERGIQGDRQARAERLVRLGKRPLDALALDRSALDLEVARIQVKGRGPVLQHLHCELDGALERGGAGGGGRGRVGGGGGRERERERESPEITTTMQHI